MGFFAGRVLKVLASPKMHGLVGLLGLRVWGSRSFLGLGLRFGVHGCRVQGLGLGFGV